MFNFSKIIDKILKFDQLNSNINLDRFNNEERGLLKLVCYKNHTLNFQFYKKTKKYGLRPEFSSPEAFKKLVQDFKSLF